MTAGAAWLITVVCIAGSLFLWFRDVKRIMQERKNTVESAASQLAVCRRRVAQAMQDAEASAVLARSEDIYRQAVAQYHWQLQRPLIRLPAMILGYRSIR